VEGKNLLKFEKGKRQHNRSPQRTEQQQRRGKGMNEAVPGQKGINRNE